MTAKRRISVVVHVMFALIPLICGTYASYEFWTFLFGPINWGAPLIIVGVMEVLALTSMVLYIGRIEWPLSSLRHTLPFMSFLPLGWELYLLLDPNIGWLGAGVVATGLTGWFIYLSFVLYHSLERLFISPQETAREKAQEQSTALKVAIEQFSIVQEAAKSSLEFTRKLLTDVQGLEDNEPKDVTPLHLPQSAPHWVESNYDQWDKVEKAIAKRLPDQPILINDGDLDTSFMETKDDADPRLRKIVELASRKTMDGEWQYTQVAIRNETKADINLISTVCKLVRSGQLTIKV